MIDFDETVKQLGGRGLSGALVYCGVGSYSQYDANKLNDGSLEFFVNGKPGYKWSITVTLEYNDTYTVRLIQSRGAKVKILSEKYDVYCDELKKVFEDTYDNGVKQHNGGFITLR